jgi:hypothetical protein
MTQTAKFLRTINNGDAEEILKKQGQTDNFEMKRLETA